MPERLVLKFCGLRHVAFSIATLATDPNFGQVAAGPTFVDPQLTVLRRAVVLVAMNEAVPVNVPDMAAAAGPYKSNRYNRSLLAVAVDEPSASECLPMYEHSRATARFRGTEINILRNEPLRELKAVDSCGRRSWVFLFGRRRE